MSYIRRPSNQFKKSLKLMAKRGYKLHKLEGIIDLLAEGKILPKRCRPHKLVGQYVGKWECHIEPDWLLIYEYDGSFLDLAYTGTHADLFD